MEKCKICKKRKGDKDYQHPDFYCRWDGFGTHPRFVWKRRRRKGKYCMNCERDSYLGDIFCTDLKEKREFCRDCGELIILGIEYQKEKTP